MKGTVKSIWQKREESTAFLKLSECRVFRRMDSSPERSQRRRPLDLVIRINLLVTSEKAVSIEQ